MNGLGISSFIQSLPKVELHVHIEGTLTPRLRWKLAKRNSILLPYSTYEELLASYKVTYNHRKEVNGDNGAPTFLEAYYAGCQVLCQEEDFYELAMEYFEKAKAMNVRYAEPFFDTQAHTERGIPAEAVLNGYLRAQKDGATKYGVRSNWIFCFLRDRPLEDGIQAYRSARPWARIEGGQGLFHAVGLASNEYNSPPLLFERGFQLAREDNLHITLHCDVDQKDAAAHIHEAIFTINNSRGTQRIDHGLNVLDSPELISGLKQRNIGLTLCPHAYHRRQKTEILFPKIRRLWDEGVKICFNSDDPTYMHDVWIDGNMQKMVSFGGFSEREMMQSVVNAVDMCWAEAEVKHVILAELSLINGESTV